MQTTNLTIKNELIEKLKNRTAKSAVIGMGYVGLPLAVEFGNAGLEVYGIDLNQDKIQQLKKGESYIVDVPSAKVKKLVDGNKFFATDDFSVLKDVDTVNICVPTPLRKTKDPDISYIVAAAKEIVKYLHKGQLIILESTTYPGTTDEVLLPLFEEQGFKVGEDFFLAFSPERVDPGNPTFNTKNITKVVGGMTPACCEVSKLLYEMSVETVFTVSSPKVAEMVKLLENTFRSVNIGLVNEICLMCHSLGVDVWEVIDAAATKPFGFMPFYPGPGLGGHCIPIDPFYLSWKARLNGFEPRFIELAGEVNRKMPELVVQLATDILNEEAKAVRNSKIAILGIAYKSNIDDTRESPALEIVHDLEERGAEILPVDPYVDSFKGANGKIYETVKLTDDLLQSVDLVIIATNHKDFNYEKIIKLAPKVLDTRNATKGLGNPSNLRKI